MVLARQLQQRRGEVKLLSRGLTTSRIEHETADAKPLILGQCAGMIVVDVHGFGMDEPQGEPSSAASRVVLGFCFVRPKSRAGPAEQFVITPL